MMDFRIKYSLAFRVLVAGIVMVTIAISTILGAEVRPQSKPVTASSSSEGILKPVCREEIYEFKQKPVVVNVGDGRYRISFTVKGKCDVAVAIENADGRIIRHLAGGVLGANAPEPLQKNSLSQKLVWDGRDDVGRKVTDPSSCRVRVSLGLRPTFDRVLYGHDKNTTTYAAVEGIAADKDGVYVLYQGMYLSLLRMYDHSGDYVRTLIPFRGDKMGDPALNIKTRKLFGRTVPDRLNLTANGFYRAVRSDGTGRAVGRSGKLAAAGGWIVTLSDTAQLLRMRSDGTTGGAALPGPAVPVVGKTDKFPVYALGARVALSSDGRWLYVTGLRPKRSKKERRTTMGRRDGEMYDLYDRAVWRVRRDVEGEIGKNLEPFLGGGNDGDKGLMRAQGIACDARGRIYVCDPQANRIQVYAPDGSYVKAVPVSAPREVAVHQKSGEIYVLCEKAPGQKWMFGGFGKPYTANERYLLRKLRSLDDPKVLLEQEFTAQFTWPYVTGPFTPVLCVDSWSDPATIWLVHHKPGPTLYADRGDKLELIRDFVQEVRDAGVTQGVIGEGINTERMAVDPVRGDLYYARYFVRGRWEFRGEAAAWRAVVLSSGGGGSLSTTTAAFRDMGFSADGLLYAEVPGMGTLRFDPARARLQKDKNGNTQVLFPPESIVPFAAAEKPVEKNVPAGTLPTSVSGARSNVHGLNWAVAPDGAVVAVVVSDPADKRSRPCFRRWDRDGNASDEGVPVADPDPRMATNWLFRGMQTDGRGRFYISKRLRGPGGNHRFSIVRLLPGGVVSKKESVLWSYPGYQSNVEGACKCINGEFETDVYGRSFIPRPFACMVGVVDANGNRICEIGRYGNADTRGPKDSTVRVGGQEIGLAWCWHLAVQSDRWLYLLDNANVRLLRVKLGYHAEKIVKIAGARGTATQ